MFCKNDDISYICGKHFQSVKHELSKSVFGINLYISLTHSWSISFCLNLLCSIIPITTKKTKVPYSFQWEHRVLEVIKEVLVHFDFFFARINPKNPFIHIQTPLANACGYMVDYFMGYNFKIWWWVLIGAWAAIGTNTVFFGKILKMPVLLQTIS